MRKGPQAPPLHVGVKSQPEAAWQMQFAHRSDTSSSTVMAGFFPQALPFWAAKIEHNVSVTLHYIWRTLDLETNILCMGIQRKSYDFLNHCELDVIIIFRTDV